MTATKAPAPPIGSVVETEIHGSTFSRYGFVQYDYDCPVTFIVTQEHIDCWNQYDYPSFEEMLVDEFRDDVQP